MRRLDYARYGRRLVEASLDKINEGYADMHAGRNIRGVIVHEH